MHPSFRGARHCGQIPLEKVKWGSERNGPLACARTFYFWTFRHELFIGATFTADFVCSHQRGALECSKGTHVCCPWVWSRVCCWHNLRTQACQWGWYTGLTYALSCQEGGDERVKMPLPCHHSFQPDKSLRHSSLFFSSPQYYFGSPFFPSPLHSGDTHHSGHTICLVLKWIHSFIDSLI